MNKTLIKYASVGALFFCANSNLFGFASYPKKFQLRKNKNVIQTDARNIISFGSVSDTFNPSNININGEEYLFVRKEGDEIKNVGLSRFYDSYIGVTKIHDGQCGELKFLDLGSKYVEDPRGVVMGDKVFLFYNDIVSNDSKYRVMKVAVLNFDFSVEKIFTLDFQERHYEKNWIPFVDRNHPDEFYFIYSFSPFRVFRVKYIDQELVVAKVDQAHDAFYNDLSYWEADWGEVHGGGPLVQINDDTFFGLMHSSFFARGENKRWYVFGSVVMKRQNDSFYLESMSTMPIVYKHMYSMRFSSKADRKKRVLFPSGLKVEGNSAEVFLGVNDTFTERVVFPLDKLMQKMKHLR